MRQFTLMKEVEAKIHGPTEKLGEMVDALMEYPVPSRKRETVAGAAVGSAGQGLLSLTMNNSAAGSANASVINGVVPNTTAAFQHLVQDSVSGSVNGDEVAQQAPESEDDLVKRHKFHELRLLTHNMLANLDEKNVVLAEATRVLSQQATRINSVMPYVEKELSEEARLGSMTHWAYSDNRQKKQATSTTAHRRDVVGTNSLAAAASAIHENEIAQARRDATRETAKEKRGRAKEHVDSDFDDKPKKTHAKVAKSKAAAQTGAMGLGISANGEPVKRRKVDKSLVAPGMERIQSAAGKAAKRTKETPRSTPNAEPSKKATKMKPAPLPAKRKGMNSAHASPALASSPLVSSFNASAMEPPVGARTQSARLRQNSSATNLRHERLVDDDSVRLTSVAGKVNGEKVNGKRKAADDALERDNAKTTIETSDTLKREDIDLPSPSRPYTSRSASHSGKAGRGSNTGTPRTENFTDVPSMLRTRSTRSIRANTNGAEDSSSEPQVQGIGGSKHSRHTSNSHLIKQLAPFNRSPDLDRRMNDDMDEDLDSLGGRPQMPNNEEHAEPAEHSPKRRPPSRRNTAAQLAASSPPLSEHAEEEDAQMPDVEEEPEEVEEIADDHSAPDLERPASANLTADVDPGDADIEYDEAEAEVEEEDFDSEPGDPDDPNEPKYCYCDRGSYGEMIACDNEQCPREWFHLGCTELRETPAEDELWYCAECRPLFVPPPGRKGKGGGRGRGSGK